MNIKIDGKNIEVIDVEKNIVEICDDNGIALPAPCFRQKKIKAAVKGVLLKLTVK